MHIGLLPIALLVALGLLALAVWALMRLVTNRAAGHSVTGPAIAVIACCATVWLGLCFFFMILASLGHSGHPLRDSWLECLVSFLILVVSPLPIVIWLSRRKAQ